MQETDIRGRFLWYDLMTTDPTGGQAFYAKVAGLGAAAIPDPSMPYTMFTRGGVPIGGSMQLPDEAVKMGAPPHWIAYIGTPDVDKTVAAGGAIGRADLRDAHGHPERRPVRGAGRSAGRDNRVLHAVERTAGQPCAGGRRRLVARTRRPPTSTAAAAFYSSARPAGRRPASTTWGRWGSTGCSDARGHTLGGMFEEAGRHAGAVALDCSTSAWPDIHEGGRRREGQRRPGAERAPWKCLAATGSCSALDPQGAVFALHQRKAG